MAAALFLVLSRAGFCCIFQSEGFVLGLFSPLTHNGPAAMRRELGSCVGRMTHRCMFLAGVVIGFQSKRPWAAL